MMQYVDRAEQDIAKVQKAQADQSAIKPQLDTEDIEKIVSAVKETTKEEV